MSEFKFHAPDEYRKNAWIKTMDEYKQMYDQSIEKPEEFWTQMADQFYWEKRWDSVRDYNYSISKGPINIEWFKGGKTNITYNCLDRHLKDRGDQTALIWEGNSIGEDREISYKELYEMVCQFANVLKSKGVQKGDRVAIYMPMIPELAVTMLACARIGAIHSIVFGGFSADALSNRILDSLCKVLVTSDGVMRGAKAVPLKGNADTAMDLCEKQGHLVECCVVVNRTGSEVEMKQGRDVWWHEQIQAQSMDCPVEWMDAEDPLFILYTSGSTGTPKGVQHNVGGYMVYTGITFRYIFDYHDNDIYWCTADIGWVTGHSYIVYGPLSQGATSIMFEGVPNYPDPGRFWATVDKWKVNQFYTAPTAIRALMAQGEQWVEKYDLSSLRLLGSVGEPINPEAWKWYFKHVGKERCPIVDTWWQTETGGIMITALPYAIDQKPGSATLPFFGVNPVLLNEEGKPLEGACDGILAIQEPWPGQMRTVYNNHERFEKVYFQMFDGYYFAGDGCRRDEDGYYWITGRVDDVINVSGHRMGTAEVESALVSHKEVAEAAVIGFPHDIKGQGIYAFVTLNVSATPSDELLSQLKLHVRKEIGPIATPDIIHFAPALPKTRSGKIMRRILRKIATDEFDSLGDISTLADPEVVGSLIENHKELTSN
ncbi:acetate--CoA ligase [Desulfobacula toluolica]|uniref:Acetyl-coenzyme A synthetase n=1 Tax=Desulfobacula toluolica (strain DSM 7467 / Tol2) TaxID=651182 RepID=K0ND50_DESTT|nr:acetate--CoA ligase [Desulfobacula toluolica]CCK78690.1 AcsA: acetyl-coenzyme A synthetase (acetate--CoA ligase) [Desulfobacula toluolica Tol2]